MSDSLAERIAAVRLRVDAACRRAGRDPASVLVLAVSKRHPAAAVLQAHELGLREFGENYAQELVEKSKACAGVDLHWHFIGKLQRNKARLVVGLAELIHTVDSERLAAEIDARAAAAGIEQRVLIEVNVGGEAQKTGVAPQDAPALLEAAAALPRLRVEGLMTMPPFATDPEQSRPHFRDLAALRQQLRTPQLPLATLSMGTTADLEVAIEEGATIVRIGTAVFGPRPA